LEPPTKRDVAKRADLSTTTLSHVINETRFVEEGTKRRALVALAELGYLPSVVARSLITYRAQTVGMIVSDCPNCFFAEVLCGIEDVLRPEDCAFLVCNSCRPP
jgi:LacI family transcriptional regulator